MRSSRSGAERDMGGMGAGRPRLIVAEVCRSAPERVDVAVADDRHQRSGLERFPWFLSFRSDTGMGGDQRTFRSRFDPR